MADYCFHCGRAQPSKFGKKRPVRLPILCPQCGNAAGELVAPMVGDVKQDTIPCPNCGQWLRLRSQAINGQYKVEIYLTNPPPVSDVSLPF